MTEAQGLASLPEQAQASVNEAQAEAQRYACDACQFTSSSKKGLAGHMRLQHQRPVKENPLGNQLDEVMSALDTRLGNLTEEVKRVAAVSEESSKPRQLHDIQSLPCLMNCSIVWPAHSSFEAQRYRDRSLSLRSSIMQRLNEYYRQKRKNNVSHFTATFEFVVAHQPTRRRF